MSKQALARPRAPLASSFAATGLGLAACLAFAACDPADKPAPTKIEEGQVDALKRPVSPEKNKVNTGLKPPDLNTPAGSDGEQIAAEQVEARLAAGRAFLAENNEANAMSEFRRCANREPASARCDGELGVLLEGRKRRKAAAQYYLNRAATHDDPLAKAQLYARVGDKLRKLGELEIALQAWDKAVAREPSAEHHAGRSSVLQSLPGRLVEAADELAAARAIEDRDEWMLDEGMVRGMDRSDPAQAQLGLKLLLEVAERTKDEKIKQRANKAAAVLRQSLGLREKAQEHRDQVAKKRADEKDSPAPAAPQ